MLRVKMRNNSSTRLTLLSTLFLLAFFAPPAAPAQSGSLVREKVHGVSLEKTVTGELPDRNVAIYLPPSYRKSPARRYPVVYLLHGIGGTEQDWVKAWSDKDDGFATIQGLMDRGIAEGKFGEMIIVMPDEETKWFGSFYTNSPVTGNWADFTAKDLVGFVDNKYRTIADAKSRGIAGHSMGGYGALTLGMKHPEVYSVVYGMNSAVMGWSKDLSIDNPAFAKVLNAKSFDQLMELFNKGDFYPAAIVTVAQAFSPNPHRPPFYADFPFAMIDGKLQPAEPAFSKWQEKFPVRMVEEYKGNLLKLRGIRFDSGYEDEFLFIPPNSRALSTALTSLGIDHVFEEYNGDHRNRLWGRRGRIYTEVLPYFWLLLESQK